jgi:hypothetical protein
LRRFLNFFEGVVQNASSEVNSVSTELVAFFNAVVETLKDNKAVLSGSVSDTQRKTILDGLGTAGSAYRDVIYTNGFSSERNNISKTELLQFLTIAKQYLDHSIAANKREDKLYHAYNLMTVENETEVSISYLPEMLEGQVAVLSSGNISAAAALEVLDALKESALFRKDQYSYILYPNKQLPRFSAKNTISTSRIEKSQLVQQLLKDGQSSIVERDIKGDYHFNGSFNNADSLKSALANLSEEKYGKLIAQDTDLLLAIFESVFDHKSFTGRSGTFYGYEGLGSIYWHMVSKLLLSVQEICLDAYNDGESDQLIGRLLEHYYEINEGIGVHKSPELYGAFPTDPYSHTPGGKGAQQPGMTGQVKEDVLCRFGELGVVVSDGILSFNPRLLRKEEFLRKPKTFEYISISQGKKQIELKEGMLAFTYCQVPIVYQIAEIESLKIEFNNQEILEIEALKLDADTSRKVFQRTGKISQIVVSVNK